MAIFASLCLFLHLPNGFRSTDLRHHVADLMGVDRSAYGPGQMTYDLRRLRLKGVIWREPGTRRYFVTPDGYQASLFLTRLYARILRPGFSCIDPDPGIHVPHPLRTAFQRVNLEVDKMLHNANFDRLPKT